MSERAVLVGFGIKPEPSQYVKDSLAELVDLTEAAGADVVGTTWQIVTKRTSATLIGSGKVEEVGKLIEETDATLAIVDHALSGVQSRNLEERWKTRVLDRNQLILDIFAQRAQTYEGKLQVELAQLLDQMPRMVGAWLGSLSRQGGGIGTRGPGEKAIETDRRIVQKRVDLIRKQLEKVRKNRKQHRQARKKQKVPSFALIGYTNAGKSTLLNKLTGSKVLSKDQVFATLDPTTRKVFLDGTPAVMTDTVGFIQKLPPQLVEAFKATLEESAEADVLLHIADLSNPHLKSQLETVENLIEEFEWKDKPCIYVFNKCDVASPEKSFQIDLMPRVFVSAETGEGLEQLKNKMLEALDELAESAELYFPKEEEGKIFDLARDTKIIKKEPGTMGTVCHVKLTPPLLSKWGGYITSKNDQDRKF